MGANIRKKLPWLFGISALVDWAFKLVDWAIRRGGDMDFIMNFFNQPEWLTKTFDFFVDSPLWLSPALVVIGFSFLFVERKFFQRNSSVEIQMKDEPVGSANLAQPIKLTNAEEQWLQGETDTLPGPRTLTSSITEKIFGKQRVILTPVEDDQDQTQWLEIVDVFIQEGVQLQNRARKAQWYHYHHQDWRDDYWSWFIKLLSAVGKQYGPEKQKYVKDYISDKPRPPEWPNNGIQNFITEDAWRLEGELEWLRDERDKLKSRR